VDRSIKDRSFPRACFARVRRCRILDGLVLPLVVFDLMKQVFALLLCFLPTCIADAVEFRTLELDKPLTVRPDSPELSSLSFSKVSPSDNWSEPEGTPLITFTVQGSKNEMPLPNVAYASFCIEALHIDCKFKCAGVYFDLVTGATFNQLSIVRSKGEALKFRRTKESWFVGTNIWGCESIHNEPLIDLSFSKYHSKGLDGNNQLHFYGIRADYCSHKTYVQVGTTHPLDSRARMISFSGGQFHIPTPKRKAKGLPDHFYDDMPNRRLFRLVGKAGPVYVNPGHRL